MATSEKVPCMREPWMIEEDREIERQSREEEIK
jgi:hypothetical protein